jgi:sucrose-6-phosphate hydrolase SacC (GH32 family)
MKVRWLVLISAVLFAAPLFAAEPREAVLDRAQAHWRLGDGSQAAKYPLQSAGSVVRNVAAEGEGANADAKVAKLAEGYFNAGKDLNLSGDQCTVYLRARDPRGQWGTALLAKRGSHDTLNVNLYSLPGTIGFEIHTEKGGFVGITFPISEIDPKAWHDFAARYDGDTIELLCDGKAMVLKPWQGGKLTQNQEPLLIGAETEAGKIVRPFSGEMEEAAIWSRALSDEELAKLMRKEKILALPKPPRPYASPIHFRPKNGALIDTIPFYWKGEYHVFYLRGYPEHIPWEHIVSTDLVHWRELPAALVADGAPDSPDGGHMFTGSVCERDGVFHIYYTGHNPNNPEGLEFIMHATSNDLIHWEKHPADILRPDGATYRIGEKSNPQAPWDPSRWDFRDPHVSFLEEEKCYWMVFLGDEVETGRKVPGLAISSDLRKWEFQKPFQTPGAQECPDLFKIGDTWYLIGADVYCFSKDLHGEFKAPPVQNVIDRPGIYAGKRMFDGKRHVWTGWVSDSSSGRDGGGLTWGGTQCLPRELYAGPDGQLYQKPVDEVTAVFTQTVMQFDSPRDLDSACVVPTPDHYMLQSLVQLDSEAMLTITMRQQADGGGYNFVMRAKEQEAELNGPGFSYKRHCTIDTGKPIKFQAFVQGTIIECFINDQFAYTSRAYNFARGSLGLKVEGGKAKVLELAVKTDEPDFHSLFDGRTLDGWKAPDMSYWSIEDEAITAEITEAHPCTVNQYLVWHEPMDDFELKLKFRITGSPQTNSGFQFRSRLLPDNDMAGYQMDNNRDSGWLARLYEEHGRHTLAFRGKKAIIGIDGQSTLTDIPDAGGEPWFQLEEWHEYDLTCQGSHLTLKINGRLAAEVVDNDPNRQALSGLLGLQLHSGPPMTVQFKNIRLKRLK